MIGLKVNRGRVGWIDSRLAHRRKVALGPWGEWIALRWLLHQGWDVIARNWRTSRGEIDLIAFDSGTLVFIEVKTRRSTALLPPEEGVDDRKRDQLERLSIEFQSRLDHLPTAIRYDLIGIETEDLRNFTLRHHLGFM